MLEISVTVNVAPGILSGYTNIVRFFPRYVLFNRLERPIRLWQDSSIVRPVSEDRAAASNMLEVGKESRSGLVQAHPGQFWRDLRRFPDARSTGVFRFMRHVGCA